jgi:hypothetical protein
MNWHRDAFKSLTTVSLSVFVSTLVARLIFSFTVIEIWAIVALFFLFLLFFIITIKSEWIGEKYWVSNMRKKFQAPLIGILHEVQCENIANGHPFTSFLSNDWSTELRRLGLNTKLISIDELTDKYAVVINPYGEVYPDRDPILISSFQKIREYIRRGGIFVCAGGIPFFYCWDSRTRQRITLSKILQAYVQIGQNNLGQNVLVPQFFYPPLYSLLDTLVNEHFGVSVIGDIQPPPNAPQGWQPIFQTHQANEDIQYVGNLAQIGGSNQVFVFRSIMPITRCCIPFLRAHIPNFGEVYPIAGIPYERGLLIVCGMDLQTTATVGNINIARGEFEKVCSSINNILNGIRLETIFYDWRRQR